jgi:hypothetical protein
MTVEEVAHRMFIRNVADYAEAALADRAWIDPDIRGFWVQQAEAVVADLIDLTAGTDVTGEGRVVATPPRFDTSRSHHD